MTKATHETNAPIRSGTLDPTVLDKRPDTGPASSIPSVAGTMNNPALVTEAPKPKPVLVGSSTSSGTSTNEANIPKPRTSAARLVVHTGRRRIMRMSTSGSSLRDSTRTHAAARTIAAASEPSVPAEIHPQLEPSLTGTSKATSQPASSRAPAGLIRPGVRTGDSGTNTTIPTAAATTATSGSQNSQWYDRCCTTGPASTIPSPPPMPMIAEISAIPCGIRLRGNSSRMIANASGKTAPPAP